MEGRPRWPAGNLQSTLDFRDLLQAKAAPSGPVVAVLSGRGTQMGRRQSPSCRKHVCQSAFHMLGPVGHTHEDAVVSLSLPADACEPSGRSWTVRSEACCFRMVKPLCSGSQAAHAMRGRTREDAGGSVASLLRFKLRYIAFPKGKCP